ncbi:MAG: hypothetical protein ACP5LD_01025 [Desulfomonilaceae bacterium]
MSNLAAGAVAQEIVVDGKTYSTYVVRKRRLSPAAHRLVVVSRLTNNASQKILSMCVRSIERFTPEPHELWIVDNNSPEDLVGVLVDLPEVNVIFNRTEPIPPQVGEAAAPTDQLEWGSYANAIGLELAARVIDPETRYLMTLHMDSLPCHPTWLSFLTSQLTAGRTEKGSPEKGVAAAGVRMDTTRSPEGVLHILGCLVDYQVFRALGLSFFPELPAFDVGDKVTIGLRAAGYGVFACRNTLWEPELQDKIDPASPWRAVPVDRALDRDNRVIFCHLGRGVRKASGSVAKGASIEEWLEAAQRNLDGDYARGRP